jgi:uncharacterized protein (DUF302 family)
MMIETTSAYGIGTTVGLEVQEALARVKQALSSEGFGILCDIDVEATLKTKLGVDLGPYVILGACNPALAYRALSAEPDLGLLLPCNVIVRAGDGPGTTVIAAMDPVAALGLSGNATLHPVADEVKARLARALATVERDAAPA